MSLWLWVVGGGTVAVVGLCLFFVARRKLRSAGDEVARVAQKMSMGREP